jgi:predicted CXXCH cytochrome family protein
MNPRALTLALSLLVAAVGARAEEVARYVGAAACASCHVAETKLWQESHHALAMLPVSAKTALGNFDNATIEHFGVTSTFHRDGDRFMVRTDGPDGKLNDYPLAYTFGWYPLQQYLIEMPGGRMQALGIAWDSRPAAQGGQRWFHLYPDQALPPSDPVHWTGRDQTWNYQCADCHSTDLVRGYDLDTNTYKTTWSDVNVACEACHGPGSRHVAWAQAHAGGGAYDADPHKGLVAWLAPTDDGHWEMNAETGIAQRTQPLVSRELDTCATCHARRKALVPTPAPGGAFLDSYLPALLEPGLYFPDGQIDGEVYEYGSFMQSKMHAAGVTCSNCHDPHSAKLRAEGNAVCAQCHMPAKFDVPEHHHHQVGSTGAQCAACHMPTRTYMVVDARRDHSMRVPRPDLSTTLGTPNACTACHTDRSADWAAQAVASWFPNGRQTQPQYGTTLQAGRTVAPGAGEKLDALVLDRGQPGIARASAVLLLPNNPAPGAEAALLAAIADPDPLLRVAAARAMGDGAPPAVTRAGLALLSDPVRAVRVEAARALAGTDPTRLTQAQRMVLDAAVRELETAELVDAERPEAHLNLGLLDLRRGRTDAAASQYRTALHLDPRFVPAMLNLADLDRARGQDAQGVAMLREALQVEPDNADAAHALGLALVRARDYAGAMPLLQRASELAPGNARYAYVYGVALNSTGSPKQALLVLEAAHRRHPGDADILIALTLVARDLGQRDTALRHARELAVLRPGDAEVAVLVRSLSQ